MGEIARPTLADEMSKGRFEAPAGVVRVGMITDGVGVQVLGHAVELHPLTSGGWQAIVPALPGCMRMARL